MERLPGLSRVLDRYSLFWLKMCADNSHVLASMILNLDSKQASTKLNAMPFRDQIDLVLSVPEGRRRMDLILLAEHSKDLLQSIPPEDFVLTIKHIGDHDAVPLLELSSDEQLTYLLDLETWIKAGMDLQKLTHWLGLLFECGHDRVHDWMTSSDFEQLVLLFDHTLIILYRDDIESLPDTMSSRIMTPDDTHFFLIKLGVEYSLFANLINLIYAEERELFYALAANLGTNPPAEVEEQAFRWRCGRLADRGWPSYDEAIILYQVKKPENIQLKETVHRGFENPPHYLMKNLNEGSLFNPATELLSKDARMWVASQLANLVNRTMVADNMTLTDIESIKRAASRTSGYLEIGMSTLNARDVSSCSRLLEKTPLMDIFQVAYGEIQKRVDRAKTLWSSSIGSMSSFLGTPLSEKIKALLQARPLFFSDHSGAPEEFSNAFELTTLDRDLDLAEATLYCCQRLEINKNTLPDPFPTGCHPESIEGLSAFALLNTVFSNQFLAYKPCVFPFPFERLGDLLCRLPQNRSHLSDQLGNWLQSSLDQIPTGLDQLIDILTSLLLELYPLKDHASPDPRFIDGLWVRKHTDD